MQNDLGRGTSLTMAFIALGAATILGCLTHQSWCFAALTTEQVIRMFEVLVQSIVGLGAMIVSGLCFYLAITGREG